MKKGYLIHGEKVSELVKFYKRKTERVSEREREIEMERLRGWNRDGDRYIDQVKNRHEDCDEDREMGI